MPTSQISIGETLLQKIIIIIIIGGVITGFIGTYIQTMMLNDPAGNTMTFIGNILSITGLISLIPILVSIHYKYTSNHEASIIDDFIMRPLPSLMTIGVLIYSTFLSLFYKNLLIQHRVSSEYYTYSFLFSTLLFMQVLLLGKYLFDNIKLGGKTTDSLYKYAVYLFSAINFILLSIMQIILKFFSTDG